MEIRINTAAGVSYAPDARDYHDTFPGFNISRCGRNILEMERSERPAHHAHAECADCEERDTAALCQELSKDGAGLTVCPGYIEKPGLACPRRNQHATAAS